jgi:hypothetical protein
MFIRRAPTGACRWLPLAAACLLPAVVFAGTTTDTASPTDQSANVTQAVAEGNTPLDTLDVEGVYVGQSSFRIKRGNGSPGNPEVPYGSISETDLSFEYGHRFHLFGKVYLKLSAEYERFDFSTTDAPIPTSLQSLGGIISVEYIQQGEVGAFFRVSPGIYYSDLNQVNSGNFNAPIALGTILPIGKKFYVLVGLENNVLAKYPVFPILGFVWLITDHLRVMATPPDPELIYSVSDALDLFIVGEIIGDSYKRDYNPDYRPQDQRFSGAVVDYEEMRVGGGLTYTPVKKLDLDIDVAGGWDLGQDFDFYRGESTKRFRTHGAPYARLSVSAKF